MNGTAEGGAQAKFMDRNLGALAATTAKPTAALAYKYFGVLYQHGRSAPFSGQGSGETVKTYTVIYNGAATKLSSGSIGGYTQSNSAVSSVTSALQAPNTYYYKDMGSGYYKGGNTNSALTQDTQIHHQAPQLLRLHPFRGPQTKSA